MTSVQPSVLLLGSRFDLTCDYVVAQLRRLGITYLRLNSEDLPELELGLDPVRALLDVRQGDTFFRLDSDRLRSVFYRRPVFLRDYGEPSYTPFERFQRYQWAAFLRNLMVLDSCHWVNHPAATYLAEHKAVQLRVASKVGFTIPETVIANQVAHLPAALLRNDRLVAKGLDTVLLRRGSRETFGFTHILDRSSILDEEVRAAPVLFQKPIVNKLDIRVTVVGSDVFAASIVADGEPIEGDWRCRKGDARFLHYSLPAEVAMKCIRIVTELGLGYGAIDLALEGEKYYFLEINPTGEWAWLVDSADLPIDATIAKCLANPELAV